VGQLRPRHRGEPDEPRAALDLRAQACAGIGLDVRVDDRVVVPPLEHGAERQQREGDDALARRVAPRVEEDELHRLS
jgi:hypothetical protein